jgi:hypothetical protein
MSRRDRRAALARGKAEPTANLTELAARATLAFQEGRSIDAEVLCRQILALDARQPTALNIVGLLYQASAITAWPPRRLRRLSRRTNWMRRANTISPPPIRHWVSVSTQRAITAMPSHSA